jgi:transcriptional regulator with XRE-family HTH domain
MDNQKIGDYINSLRKDRHLTQKELANRLGVTDKAVSKWERGAGYPDIGMLRPLADALGTTVNELLEGESGEQGN